MCDFASAYLLVGLILLWPLWWRGPVDNPVFVLLFWPIVVLGMLICWVDDKRHESQSRRLQEDYRRRMGRRQP